MQSEVTGLDNRERVQDQAKTTPGLHVAIIMDGNGRWARARGLPRTAGHKAGSKTVRAIVEAAPKQGVAVLTLYAFSADNWKRPASEVEALMRLMERYLMTEYQTCIDNGVRLSVIGRRDRLEPRLVRAIERVEQATCEGRSLHLRIAVDYSARQAIAAAARRWPAVAPYDPYDIAGFGRAMNEVIYSAPSVPDVDLLIRTGGEQRLSDFLLWECAYAELLFVPQRWPDFTEVHFAAAIEEYCGRERRFGQVGEAS